MRSLKILFLLTLLSIFQLITPAAHAASQHKPLSAEQAFVVKSQVKNGQLLLQWTIAPGHYMYRDSIRLDASPENNVKYGSFNFPKGKIKKDPILGDHEIYTNHLKLAVPLESKGILKAKIIYRGCAVAGVCYPPMSKQIEFKVTKIASSNTVSDLFASNNKSLQQQSINQLNSSVVLSNANSAEPADAASSESDQEYATQLLQGHNIFVIILAFLGLGLLIAFTPCVLPMLPILSGIIMGQRNEITTRKAFLLSLAYVLGVSMTYMVLGIMVAMAGSSFQAAMQKSWVIITFSMFFVLLSLSFFGFYQFRLPNSLQQRISQITSKQKGGTYAGSFVMGGFSTLIVSPCVTPPLVGVLAYIANTGNIPIGAMALFSLGMGTGIPLLLVGTTAGKFLPKAGSWMMAIEKVFGVVMLALAIYLVSRVIPAQLTVFLWSALLILSAALLGVFKIKIEQVQWYHIILRVAGIAFTSFALILLMSIGFGNKDPLHPWEVFSTAQQKHLDWVTVKDQTQLDMLLAQAQRENKPVMLDFYADWCTSCQLIERNVFGSSETQNNLKNYIVVRADITANNDFDRALLQKFGVVAPPTILFFNPSGKELASKRIIGEVDQSKFLTHLKSINVE